MGKENKSLAKAEKGIEWPPAGVKWYYNDDYVTIYYGDCREILPQLPQATIIVADPPYGIDYQSARRIDWQRKARIQGDKEFPLWIFDILKPKVALYVFCRWDILPILPMPKSFIVWDKCIHSMGDLEHEYGRQWEGCAFYPQQQHRFVNRPIDIIRCQRISPTQMLHPNEKPVGLIAQLIAPNIGQTVLDPFMGAGSTVLAAKKLNRKCIGIEIEEKYCEIAANRCRQMVFRL